MIPGIRNYLGGGSAGYPTAAAQWVRVTHTAGTPQSIPNNTVTTLTFDSELFDTDAMHSNAVNPTRLTAPAAKGGIYYVECTWRCAASAVGFRQIQFFFNGSGIGYAVKRCSPCATGVTTLTLATHIALAAAQYVEVNVFQDSGSAKDAEVEADASPVFTMVRLGS